MFSPARGGAEKPIGRPMGLGTKSSSFSGEGGCGGFGGESGVEGCGGVEGEVRSAVEEAKVRVGKN